MTETGSLLYTLTRCTFPSCRVSRLALALYRPGGRGGGELKGLGKGLGIMNRGRADGWMKRTEMDSSGL